MSYHLYELRNKLNGDFYVGVTNNMNRRKYQHERANSHIAHAIRKYGWDNFEISFFIEGLSKDEAYELEELIVDDELVSRDECYNHRVGGIGGFTEEMRGDRTGSTPWNKGKSGYNLPSRSNEVPSIYCEETDRVYSCCAEFCKEHGGYSQNAMRAIKLDKPYKGYNIRITHDV